MTKTTTAATTHTCATSSAHHRSKYNSKSTAVMENMEYKYYKTRWCKTVEKYHKPCPYESRCMFAHSEEELRTEEQNIAEGLVTAEAVHALQRRLQHAEKKRAKRKLKRQRERAALKEQEELGKQKQPKNTDQEEDDSESPCISRTLSLLSSTDVHQNGPTTADRQQEEGGEILALPEFNCTIETCYDDDEEDELTEHTRNNTSNNRHQHHPSSCILVSNATSSSFRSTSTPGGMSEVSSSMMTHQRKRSSSSSSSSSMTLPTAAESFQQGISGDNGIIIKSQQRTYRLSSPHPVVEVPAPWRRRDMSADDGYSASTNSNSNNDQHHQHASRTVYSHNPYSVITPYVMRTLVAM